MPVKKESRVAVVIITVVISLAVGVYGGFFAFAMIADALHDGFGIIGILGITALLVTVGIILALMKVARESLREIKERSDDDDLSQY